MGLIFEAAGVSADAPNIDIGLYDATFEGITKKFIEGGDYGDGDRYVWAFTLLDDDGAVLYDAGDPLVVDGLTSLSMNPNSKTQPKALRFMKALLSSVEYDAWIAGEAKIDSDALVGRKVQVEVAKRANGWPTIANVLPKRARRSTGPATPATGAPAVDLPF